MDISSVATAVGLVKTLKELVSSQGDVVPTEVRAQILALSDQASEIQLALLTAQQRESDLKERCRELEGELDRMKDWETTKARYSLVMLDNRAFVYTMKPEPLEGGNEPQHWLCANFFEDRRRSHLQAGKVDLRNRAWICPRCNATVSVRTSLHP